METIAMASWLLLLLLGAFHGINPGMGWLFAVARGLQEGRRLEVWRALLPLATGPTLGLGARRLIRHRHPRLGGMRVGMAGLTSWSFLMATAHGAGLMVVPVLLG